MITGFAVGTQVKWNEQGGTFTGTVREVIRKSGEYDVNGEQRQVTVTRSPYYVVESFDGRMVLLPHIDVFLKEMNEHT